jgi:type VI secretion system protein ImpF
MSVNQVNPLHEHEHRHAVRARRETRAERRADTQPSLLDRLTDHRLQQPHEFDSGLASPRAMLRDAILRDLSWLLNSANLDTTNDLDAYPHVQRSVANFGVGTLVGASASGVEWTQIECAVREAIVRFEPRILADSLEVRCSASENGQHAHALSLEISGQLRSNPSAPALRVRAALDLDSGQIALRSQGVA